MSAVRAERQWLGPAHGAQRQRAVEVREQGAAAGGLPCERRAEGVGIDRDENEVALPGEMFRGGLPDLVGGGKMNVAVGKVDGWAGKFTPAFSRAPRGGVTDFVDRLGPRHWRSHSTSLDITPAQPNLSVMCSKTHTIEVDEATADALKARADERGMTV